MRNYFLTSALSLLCILSSAQITINPQLPPIGLTVKSQLWNLSLINNTGIGQTIQIQLNVTDVSTNQTVFTALTRPFFVPPAAKQVSGSDVMPISYTSNNPAYPVDGNPNGFLPIGVFNFCYSVVSAGMHAGKSLDEACDQVQVEPLSPPMLVSPADSEHVDNSRPMFIWIPPAPNSLFSNLSYDFHLAEVNPTQSAADAIQQNIPLLYQPNVRSTNLQYPLSAPALDSTKLYAWQIVAKNNSSPVGTSEAWAFRLKKDTVSGKVKILSAYYAKVSREQPVSFITCSGILRYAYQEESNTNTIAIEIFDITKSRHTPIQLDSTAYSVRFGDNLLNLDLRAIPDMINKHMYLLELVNAKQEHWYLKFEYVRQD